MFQRAARPPDSRTAGPRRAGRSRHQTFRASTGGTATKLLNVRPISSETAGGWQTAETIRPAPDTPVCLPMPVGPAFSAKFHCLSQQNGYFARRQKAARSPRYANANMYFSPQQTCDWILTH